MERRSFLRKLALVPVMAAFSTELLFSAVKAKEPVPRENRYITGEGFEVGDVYRDQEGNKWFAHQSNELILMTHNPNKSVTFSPDQDSYTLTLRKMGNCFPLDHE